MKNEPTLTQVSNLIANQCILNHVSLQNLAPDNKTNDFNLNDKNSYDNPTISVNQEVYINPFNKIMAPKSALISVIVSDAFYNQVKEDLLLYIKMLLANDKTGNWQLSIINKTQKPFNFLNMFLTNSDIPQIVHIGYRMADEFKTVHSRISYHMGSSAKINRIYDTFIDLVYIKKAKDPRALYRQHLTGLDNQDIEPVIDWLVSLYQESIDDQEIVNITNNRYDRVFDALDIDNLFAQCHELTSESDINLTENMSQLIPEIKLIIDNLVNQIN